MKLGRLAFILLPSPSSFGSLALHLVELVGALARAELLDLDLLHAARHLDLGAVVEVRAARALEPDVFATLFCHDDTEPACESKRPASGAANRTLDDGPSTADGA